MAVHPDLQIVVEIVAGVTAGLVAPGVQAESGRSPCGVVRALQKLIGTGVASWAGAGAVTVPQATSRGSIGKKRR